MTSGLLTRAVAALALAILAALLAQGGWPSPSQAAPGAILRLQTVPRLPGVGLQLDGVTYRTDASGSVTIGTAPGTHTVALLPTTSLSEGRTARPAGWLGQRGIPSQITLGAGTTVEHVSFVVSRPVTLIVTDHAGRPLPSSQIDRVVLANSLGQEFVLKGGSLTTVLPLNGVVHPRTGYISVPVRYSVRSVIAQGGEVVHRGSQVFPAGAPTPWVIKALVFPLQIKVQDALFGFSIGRSVELAPRFGTKRTLTLTPGHTARVDALARGTYDLTPHGPGFGLTSVTTLSRPQEAKVLLFSYVDVAVVVVFAALFLVGLPILSGRMARRPGSRFIRWRERRERSAASARTVAIAARPKGAAPTQGSTPPETSGRTAAALETHGRTPAPLEPPAPALSPGLDGKGRKAS